MHGAPPFVENSRHAFLAAIEAGAGIECDVRMTADERLVVFHDGDAMRLCGGDQVIAESTLADLGGLRVGGAPIPTLDELLALVADRVPLLVEVKIDRRSWRYGPALVRALGHYRGRVGVMSFDPRLSRWLKVNAPTVRRGLVIADRLSPLRRWVAMALADPQFVAVDVAALGKPWVAAVRRRVPVYSWTIRGRDQRMVAASFADALIWEADGRP